MYPDELKCIYVGKTKNPKQRFNAHIYSQSNNLRPHFKSIEESGKKPLFVIIEECTKENSSERELYYIKLFTSQGHSLANNECSGCINKLPYEIKVEEGCNFDKNTLITTR